MEIKLENVSFSYRKKSFLKDANVLCKKGEITTFLGDSTSPLDILFSLIMGKQKPAKGDIFIGKKRGVFKNIKIGYVSKNREDMIFSKTVREELSIPLRLNFMEDKQDTEKKEALETVFLDASYLDRKIETLSKGERKKVAFASFLLEKADIYLICDPFFLFTEDEKKDFGRLLKNINKRDKKTILFATSDTVLAQQISDFVYVTCKNKILQGGKPEMIFSDQKLLERARLVMPPIASFLSTVQKEKNKKMMYRTEINDLIKDIYRYVK